MPKRGCPFVESAAPQFKSHIGQKEVNSGVMMTEKMQAIYDKTLAMMFRASKNVTPSSDSMTSPIERSINNKSGIQVLAGQRKLNFSGILDGVYEKPCGMENCFIPITCKCGSVSQSCCTYCEKAICEFCLRHCSNCSHNFCTDCSTIRSNMSGDTLLCLSCV